MIKKDRLCCPKCKSIDLFEFSEADAETGKPVYVAVCADCDFEWFIDD